MQADLKGGRELTEGLVPHDVSLSGVQGFFLFFCTVMRFSIQMVKIARRKSLDIVLGVSHF